MKAISKTANASIIVLLAAVFGGHVAWAAAAKGQLAGRPALNGQDMRSGFGRLETLSGTVSMVNGPNVVVTCHGPSEPASPQVTVTQSTTQESGATVPGNRTMSITEGPGQTDYHFKITSRTLIRVDGRPATLADLAQLQNERATIRFIPEPSGNYVTEIQANR